MGQSPFPAAIFHLPLLVRSPLSAQVRHSRARPNSSERLPAGRLADAPQAAQRRRGGRGRGTQHAGEERHHPDEAEATAGR